MLLNCLITLAKFPSTCPYEFFFLSNDKWILAGTHTQWDLREAYRNLTPSFFSASASNSATHLLSYLHFRSGLNNGTQQYQRLQITSCKTFLIPLTLPQVCWKHHLQHALGPYFLWHQQPVGTLDRFHRPQLQLSEQSHSSILREMTDLLQVPIFFCPLVGEPGQQAQTRELIIRQLKLGELISYPVTN